MKRTSRIVKILGVFIAVLAFSKNVYASENVFYTTPNGIELTEEEYTFLTNFYWEGYPDIMTQAQYEEFTNSDLLTRKLKVKKLEVPTSSAETSTRSSSHSTDSKSIQIGSACNNSNCVTSIVATWFGSPSVRSFDVIGAYLSGVSLISHNLTYVYSTSGTTNFYNLKTASNGIGNSVKLPDTGEDIVINMIFTTTKGGYIYGSYQHAMYNTTLPVSQYYNFSLGGYGNVFDFYSYADNDLYDEMPGVDISV